MKKINFSKKKLQQQFLKVLLLVRMINPILYKDNISTSIYLIVRKQNNLQKRFTVAILTKTYYFWEKNNF